jgi:hypothetical protein
VIVPGDLSEEQREHARALDATLTEENLRTDRGGGFFSRVRRAFG